MCEEVVRVVKVEMVVRVVVVMIVMVVAYSETRKLAGYLWINVPAGLLVNNKPINPLSPDLSGFRGRSKSTNQ